MTRRILLALSLLSWAASAEDKYSGPRPEKKDVPYLLHGDKLVITEVQSASQSRSKEGQLFFVPGPTSPARTPLTEPIFLFSADRFRVDQIGLFHFEVRNGRREIVISGKHKREEESFHLNIRKIDENLFRMEVSEMLNPGEYSLSPEGDNTAFCFTVY